MILTHIRRSLILGVVAIVLTFAYAYLGTGLSQLAFQHQADGSITANGSTLIGQNWSNTICPGNPKGSCVFQGRPDDLGPYASAKTNPAEHPGDDPLVANGISGESGATNLGPRSAELVTYTKELVAYWHKRGVDPTPDLVTTSGSGYDPDITPQDALVQIPMVSKATGISPSALRALIARETNSAELGFLGSSYIDVLQLNEALAQLR
jgi:potassium-transporting ATPase KdpC subunit